MNAETLRRRLREGAAHDLLARERFMPRDEDGQPARPSEPPPGIVPREGAVLVLLYPHAGQWHLPLTVRAGTLRHHSGEVSLPGGRYDTGDGSLQHTALREAWEELGVDPAGVEVIAELTHVWIPVSNFHITPYVGLTQQRPAFRPEPTEVAAVIETPLGTLLDPEIVASEVRDVRGRALHITYFLIDGYKVWGATALVLAQLVGRLAEVDETAKTPRTPR
jgi:8-oxo-dGTP pyrophosphatase MutT (NUDIX family)